MASEIKYKLKPGVLCCNSKEGVLEDTNKEYSSECWENGGAEEYVKEGFLVVSENKPKHQNQVVNK